MNVITHNRTLFLSIAASALFNICRFSFFIDAWLFIGVCFTIGWITIQQVCIDDSLGGIDGIRSVKWHRRNKIR